MRIICTLLFALILTTGLSAQSSLNIDSVSHFSYPSGVNLNDIWGYVDSSGNEYALVGKTNGLSVVSLADTTNLIEIYGETSVYSVWRDIKTWGHYAYVTNESSGGLAIYDLSTLPDSVKSVSYFTGVNYLVDEAHNIYIDENGVAYLFGTKHSSGTFGTIMLDVATNPGQPIELGYFDSLYFHDGYARGDTLYGSAVYAGQLVVLDVSNKSNPTIIGTKSTPSNFTHNSWPSDNSSHIFTTDEVVGGYVAAYDVRNLNAIVQTDRIRSRNTTTVIPHNAHVMNDFLITSYYTLGVSLIDANKPDNLVEVGYFDSSPNYTGGTFNGNWGAYPYLPSGLLLLSDIENGLFVLRPQYKRASYLEGSVKDCNGNAISQVDVQIFGSNTIEKTNILGDFKMGIHLEGYLTVELSKAGYITQRYDSVLFTSGQVSNRHFEMLAQNEGLEFVVQDVNGNKLTNVEIELFADGQVYYSHTNSSGVTLASIPFNNYSIRAGLWGYLSTCQENYAFSCLTRNDTLVMAGGYVDDFSSNQKWSVIGTDTNAWLRAKPIATFNNSVISNPGSDADSICGAWAYITGNGKATANQDDVDSFTLLQSPATDLSLFLNPEVQVKTWFYNAGVSPNDFLRVDFIDINGSTVPVDTIRSTGGSPSWTQQSYLVSSYMNKNNFRLIRFTAIDQSPDHIVEAGIDNFLIQDQTGLGLAKGIELEGIRVFPNPFQDYIQLDYTDSDYLGGRLELYDLQMRLIRILPINALSMRVEFSEADIKGLFLLQSISKTGKKTRHKLLRY